MDRRISWWKGVGLSAAIALASAGVAAESRLVATGSSTVAPVVAELVRTYERAHPDVRIDVQTGGSTRGVSDALNGLTDFGMVSRELKPGEERLHAYAIAHDGIAVITHRDNPVTGIDRQTLRKVYTGEARDWGEAGGRAGMPIVVVNKSAAHSTLELFLKYLGVTPDRVRADIIIGDNQQGLKTIAGNPAAIGYVSIGAALVARDAGEPLTLMTLDGAAPTIDNVGAGAYPITRPLTIVTREPADGHVQGLLQLARSEAGGAIIESLSFVPTR